MAAIVVHHRHGAELSVKAALPKRAVFTFDAYAIPCVYRNIQCWQLDQNCG